MKTEPARWRLDALYASFDDPAIEADLSWVERACADFARFGGSLAQSLAEAVEAFASINESADQITAYYYFLSSRDSGDQEVKKFQSRAQERMAAAFSGLAFFEIEIGALDEAAYLAQADGRKWKPWTDRIRKLARYQLSEKEEALLSRLAPFGGQEWDDMLDEMENKLAFDINGKLLSLSETVHLLGTSQDRRERAEAMREFNSTLASSNYMLLRTRALNLVAGLKAISDKDRGFPSPMSARNISNNVDDEVVLALHRAVSSKGAEMGRRYYSLLARILGVPKLSWADRNAPAPFSSPRVFEWDEAAGIVLSAYRGFSPALAALVEESIALGRIDAPPGKGKNSGAYNYTLVGKGGEVSSWTFLNYLGSARDVMTLAHELGHSVHGLLAGRAQGNLLAQAPMAYAETASIFGEMLTFSHLLAREDEPKGKLALIMGKCNDWLNSVNRQISFSMFEQRLHESRREGKASPEDLCREWVAASREMYGDIFDYSDMENLWCYVGHFMRPFYVYAYSFGELFTQSLFARREAIGADFEPLYLDMLASGGSRDAVELMRPFGLDPREGDFWTRGIDRSIGAWLDEAEKLA
ncbi:MAG: M3 family oligoendopeptidase [Rickettsiales bacterium]|jgi:oligoendopeptidase F|nr:M3 family oligoendopeptidase [Rickettsiales bacterium]